MGLPSIGVGRLWSFDLVGVYFGAGSILVFWNLLFGIGYD